MFLSASFIMYLTFESICIVTSDADICLRSYCSLKHAGKLYIEMLTNPNCLFNFSKIKLHKKLQGTMPGSSCCHWLWLYQKKYNIPTEERMDIDVANRVADINQKLR